MAWPQDLVRLQEIDHELEEIAERLDDITRRLQDNSEVREAQAMLKRSIQVMERAQKTQKDIEFKLQQVETKLERSRQRLYGGKVRNPRELADLQAEAKSLRERKIILEDTLLEAMIAREEAEATQAAAQESMAAAQTAWEATQQSLEAERDQLLAHRRDLQEERDALRAGIPKSALESYEYLWPRTGGTPVSSLRGDICGLCGVKVLRATCIKVEKEEEAYCDGCRRLLVA
ncbi:MAG: zinc ribbon domain-containing protein [Anaerolineales bacterium]